MIRELHDWLIGMRVQGMRGRYTALLSDGVRMRRCGVSRGAQALSDGMLAAGSVADVYYPNRSNDEHRSYPLFHHREPELLGQTVVVIGDSLAGATYDIDGGQEFVAV